MTNTKDYIEDTQDAVDLEEVKNLIKKVFENGEEKLVGENFLPISNETEEKILHLLTEDFTAFTEFCTWLIENDYYIMPLNPGLGLFPYLKKNP